MRGASVSASAPREEDEVVGKAFDARLVRRLLPFLWEQRAHVGVALVAAIVHTGCQLAGPRLTMLAVDDGIGERNLRILTMVALAYLAIHFVDWGATAAQRWSISRAGQEVLFRLRLTLFEHLQRLSLDFYNRMAGGRIISRVTNDVESLNEFVTSGSVDFITDIVKLVGITVIMLQLDVRLSLLTFTLMPVLFVVSSQFRHRSRSAYRTVRRRVATVTANLAESISGQRVVKSFSREDENLRRFDEINSETRRAYMSATAISSAFFPAVEIIAATGTFLVLYFGGRQILEGKALAASLGPGVASAGVGLPDGMTVGVLFAFVGYVNQFFDPIRNLSRLYNTMQSAMAGAERVFQILDEAPTIRDRPGAIALPPVRGRVAFEHVRFGYNEQEVLHDVSFVAEPGETVAIVGPTGAGKSTIVQLLARMYDVTEGRITIDGHDIREVTLASLRSQIGTVLQDPFLFSGTVRDNIRYGRPDAGDAELMEAARAVNAHEFIMRLPEGYETQVEERGGRLSVGQRQLVSFARALLVDPRILILDEATSSVDAATELVIQRALEALLERRTAFVIAHRLSTILSADKILVIHGGRIVEQGRHDELLRVGGMYARLYAMQFAE
jgi:ABC-type multidrug transport system fused ATPase/permease subunit